LYLSKTLFISVFFLLIILMWLTVKWSTSSLKKTFFHMFNSLWPASMNFLELMVHSICNKNCEEQEVRETIIT
jgi:hypothetical protein